MASRLISLASHEAQNHFELSLRESFHLHQLRLNPPLKLILPSPSEYLTLNRAISYGVLCEPHVATVYIKHLHSIVNDGYALFVQLLVQIVDELYLKLHDAAKKQLIWVTSVVVDVAGLGFQNLLESLMRQIVSGDLSDGNLWLSFELVNLLMLKWDSIFDEEPDALASALYVYLRLLSDHYRLPDGYRELKQKEIEFCLKALREQFVLCIKLGRDLIRLLQDLFHIPEFRAFWKTLMLEPTLLKAPGFSDIRDLYCLKTSSRYFLLRVTPEMEIQLRFLLTSVKFGSHRRHQAWFATKFFCVPKRETLICDIVRFICCAHHPSNEDTHSGIIPRWAVIGWLLKHCTKKYAEANVKLALFFDWLFFDERVDMVMNIEPVMLLMLNSIPIDVAMTQSLLEFLILLAENYDVDRTGFIRQGVSSAFRMLVQKGVVHSMYVLVSCEALSPFKEKIKMFLSNAYQVPSSTSPTTSSVLECPLPVSAKNSIPESIESGSEVALLQAMIPKLGEKLKKSKVSGLETLEKLLFLYINLDCQGKTSANLSPENLASKIRTEAELGGYPLFSLLDANDVNDEIQSPTAVVIRFFMHSESQKMKEMLLFWAKNGLPVSMRMLSYALRLAYEVDIAIKKDFLSQVQHNTCYEITPLLKFHIDTYSCFRGRNNSDCIEVDRNIVHKFVGTAFSLYRGIQECLRERKTVFSVDLVFCSEWKRKRLHILFRSIFGFLSDMCVGEENVTRLLVSQAQDSELISIELDLKLKRFSIFGDSFEGLSRLITRSVKWDPIERHRLWCLIRAELSVSKFPVEKLVLGFFRSADDENDPVVVGGLFNLCSCCRPTPELVRSILLLPTTQNFPDFSAAVLATWAASCASALFSTIAGFLDKLEIAVHGGGNGLHVNKSGVEYLLSYVGENANLLNQNSIRTLSHILNK